MTVLSYVGFALYFHLPTLQSIRSFIFLFAAAAAGALAAWHFDRKSRTDFLEEHLIADLAQHDALTGTKNRRVFDDYLIRLWQQAIEDGRTIGILLIDVDHFKAYNDRYGHLAGRSGAAAGRTDRADDSFAARWTCSRAMAARSSRPSSTTSKPDEAKETAERMCEPSPELGIEHRESRTPPR